MELGEKLKEERKTLGINQVELAKKFNVSKQTVSNWERGNRLPDANTLDKLAEMYGVTIDYLLGRTEFRNSNEMKEYGKLSDDLKKLVDKISNLDDAHRLLVENLINTLSNK